MTAGGRGRSPHAGWSLAAASLFVVASPLVAASFLVAACSNDDDEAGLTVFAAASLRTVAEELETAWLAEHPEAPLTLASGASNVLASQIREGAQADVFLSADPVRPRELAADGLTAAEPVAFAGNRLTLVAAAGNERIDVAADVAAPGVRLVGVSRGAPIDGYTTDAIAGLAETMPRPEAFTEAVAANVVSREDNVRAALAKVELGEGDAAFVYITDALAAEGVREVPLPATVDVVAHYAAVQVSEAAAAAEFVRWLREPTAAAVFEAAGFEAAG